MQQIQGNDKKEATSTYETGNIPSIPVKNFYKQPVKSDWSIIQPSRTCKSTKISSEGPEYALSWSYLFIINKKTAIKYRHQHKGSRFWRIVIKIGNNPPIITYCFKNIVKRWMDYICDHRYDEKRWENSNITDERRHWRNPDEFQAFHGQPEGLWKKISYRSHHVSWDHDSMYSRLKQKQ